MGQPNNPSEALLGRSKTLHQNRAALDKSPLFRLRVISSNKDRNVYELRYFNIDNGAEEDEE